MSEPPLYRPDSTTTLFDIRSDPFLTGQCRACLHRGRIELRNWLERTMMLSATNVRFVERKLRCTVCGSHRCVILAQEIKRPERDFQLPI